MSILIFVMSRAVPGLLARLGARPLMITGSAAQVVGMLWLSQVDTSSEYLTSIAPPMTLFGLAGGLLYAPLSSVLLGDVLREDAGAASGVLQAVQQVGAAIGVAGLVAVFGTVSGSRDDLDAAGFVEAVTWAYGAGAVLALVALLLILWRVRLTTAASRR